MSISFTCPHCGKNTEVDDQYAGQTGPCAECGQPITIPGPSSKPDPVPAPRDSGGSKISVILIVAIALMCTCVMGGGILVALLLPAVTSAREAARRVQCQNNLKQIGLALHNYHDVHKCFPAASVSDADGQPAHSWRVAILPYLDQLDLYERYSFDEPWDSPNNQAVANEMPTCFACPSSMPQQGMTNYVVIVGDSDNDPETVFAADQWLSMASILDGTSNTIAVVEVSEPVPWTKPDANLKYSEMNLTINSGPNSISSDHPGGAQVLFADGSVRFLSDTTAERTLRLLIEPADGQAVTLP